MMRSEPTKAVSQSPVNFRNTSQTQPAGELAMAAKEASADLQKASGGAARQAVVPCSG
jgi:hypothetical protein